MLFDSSANKSDKFCLTSSNRLFESKSAIKYVGVFIDYKLSWEYHINHFVKQTSIAKGILSTLKKEKVYFSIAYSHLLYGITAWGGAAAKYLNKIKVQQNLIVKIITKISL